MVHSLYIHIPFCARKCIYCDFFSVPFDEALAMRYIAAVLRELVLVKDTAGELTTVYIGGGTPTTVSPLALIRLLRKITDSFRISPGAEITVEANPGTIDKEKVRALADVGVNRFSIGVQSFQDTELALLGRTHRFEDVLKAIAAVRVSGVQNISIDLIYGIPGQTLEGWSHTVAQALEIFPEHISAYELTPEKGTPLYEMIMEEKLKKPDEDTIIEMYYHTIDRLTDAGYAQYEISNFAQPGFECRHNLNYWNRGQYSGIGAGAHSFIGDQRTQNASNIEKYIESISAGLSAVEESTEISRDDAIKEAIFLGLRKTGGLNIRQFSGDFGIDIVKASAGLIGEGLLTSDGEHVWLTRKGITISNMVITQLFCLLDLP
ncbi:MAG: radical SAM family heme chaperone HemW [Thermodesulfovibrionales bacterium]|jgi:oxygen-independent coproporphyrinogen-3 oxidase